MVVCAALALTCLLLFCVNARAHAQAARQVLVRADRCPSAGTVAQMLAPLLPGDVQIARESSSRTDSTTIVQVRDAGDEYSLELPGASRTHRDTRRDCQERARVAAVFFALNLQPSAPTETAQPADAAPVPEPFVANVPAPLAAKPAPTLTPSGRSYVGAHIGLSASMSVLRASRDAGVSLGGELALWGRLRTYQLQVSAGATSPVELSLQPRAPGGAARMGRIPLVASAGYVLHTSRFELTPSLGFALDVLALRGLDLSRATQTYRTNLGADFALQAAAWLNGRVALWAGLRAALFPRSYALRVEPEQRVARTPHAFLGGQLGIACMLR